MEMSAMASDKSEPKHEQPSFLLTNNNGSYALFSSTPKSKFEGAFFRLKGEVYKTVESIQLSSPVRQVVNQLWSAEVERQGITQHLFFPYRGNCLMVELSERVEAKIALDCRQGFDSRQWGREYTIEAKDGCVLITYSKRKDSRDDNSKYSAEYDVYVAFAGDELEYFPIKTWKEQRYVLDEQRKSYPSSRWVYEAIRLRSKGFCVSAALTGSGAIAEAKRCWGERAKLKQEKEEHTAAVIHAEEITDGDVQLAYQCCRNAIDSLVVGDEGIYAGIPWFTQFWPRDELVCVKALLSIGNAGLAKHILMKYLSSLDATGQVPSRVTVHQADAAGLLFKRFDDFIQHCKEQKLLDKLLPEGEQRRVAQRCKQSLEALRKNRMVDSLVRNNADETWMDTTFGNDDRAGARIEIQALTLASLRLLRTLTGQEDRLEREMRDAVRKKMYNGVYLFDSSDDPTIRPNIFLAYYAYPELLTKEEWVACFEKALPKLWLPWGGLSSIAKDHRLFTDAYTGEDVKSYHRGDSWYWINHIAAIAMHRVSPNHFKAYIDAILKASTQSILTGSVPCHLAELSSAKLRTTEGCSSQAWSSATYVELVEELFQK